MPVLKITGGKSGSSLAKSSSTTAPAKRTAGVEKVTGLKLPTQLSEPIKKLGDALILIYGEPKIGKTSLTAQFPNSISLLFEPGGKGLRFMKMDMPTWAHFRAAVDLLIDSDYDTIVTDTADKAYSKCFEYVCRKNFMSHPSDKDWGEGWRLIRTEFQSQFDRLIDAGKGLVFVSHVSDKKMQTRSGHQYQKIVPSMGTQAADYIGPLVDVIAYYGWYSDGNRYLTIEGSEDLEAGSRLKYNFKTKSGRRIHSIPMFSDRNPDFAEEEAFKKLLNAFNNLQVNTGEPGGAVTLSNIAARPKARK